VVAVAVQSVSHLEMYQNDFFKNIIFKISTSKRFKIIKNIIFNKKNFNLKKYDFNYVTKPSQ
jgi:hypothetical protein